MRAWLDMVRIRVLFDVHQEIIEHFKVERL